MPTREEIIEKLKTVFDPEIPVNIWDMGLVYDIIIGDNSIQINMTFTSPTCPMMQDILDQVKQVVSSAAPGARVDVNLVWEPAWDLSRMSEQARIELDLTNMGW
ncbi:MAG: metal-sulfur cluster assembly factor [Alphaproteobacteria bacterium]